MAVNNCMERPPDETCDIHAVYISYLFIFTPTVFIGIILNVLNLYVMSYKLCDDKSYTFFYLRTLAFFDLIILILVSPVGIVRCTIVSQDWELVLRNLYIAYVFVPVVNVFASASTLCTVTVAIERFSYITRPHHIQTLFSKWRRHTSISIIFLLATIFNFPFFFSNTLDHTNELLPTSFSQGQTFQSFLWCRLIFMKIIPIILVVVFNILLCIKLVQMRHRTVSVAIPALVQARRARQQFKASVMLVSISVVFIVCHSIEPFAHGALYASIYGACAVTQPAFQIVRVVANIMEIFSYSTNFIFYFIFNSKFSHRVRIIMGCTASGEEEALVDNEVSCLVPGFQVPEGPPLPLHTDRETALPRCFWCKKDPSQIS